MHRVHGDIHGVLTEYIPDPVAWPLFRKDTAPLKIVLTLVTLNETLVGPVKELVDYSQWADGYTIVTSGFT
jgi:hypothetical protein